MRFQGAIFDLDGTLLDSMGVWEDIDRAFLGRRGIPVPPDYMDKVAALSFPAAAVYTIERFGLTETPEALMREWSDMAQDAYAHRVPMKTGAGEYLVWLKQRGVKLAVATASSEDLFIPALKRHGVYDLFDAFTTLKEVARGKGFPDIYQRAAEKLGLEPAVCAVFEDLAAGVAGARAGGFIAVGVYDDHAAQDKEKIIQIADAYLFSLEQGRELL